MFKNSFSWVGTLLNALRLMYSLVQRTGCLSWPARGVLSGAYLGRGVVIVPDGASWL